MKAVIHTYLPRRKVNDRRTKDITQSEVLSTIRAMGLDVKRTPEGEYRINLKGGKEKSAAYTEDPQDAIGTARAMAEWEKSHRKMKDASNYAAWAKAHGAHDNPKTMKEIQHNANLLKQFYAENPKAFKRDMSGAAQS